ncbi:MAG TPA: NAD(P)/FAD-dependent oxidoreductase [Candidatus Saccharimonadales bacterium]|nr:NAD(P)/FAD-dependent oxidoreductase [Candidatus Saccharimonadales bacterium]
MKTTQTEVLVVGAGPVGMMTALALARRGVKVQIIDRAHRPATHTYACLLHAGSLRLLGDFDVAGEVLRQGQEVHTLAFYENGQRQAEFDLGALPGPTRSGAVVIAQSALEDILEERLRNDHGIRVEWNHRLSELTPEPHQVTAVVDELGEVSKGYAVPSWQWAVRRSHRTRAAFVIGADGHNSCVRQSLSIEFAPVAEPECYEVYEMVADGKLPEELRVCVEGSFASAYWPLPGKRCRWSLQVAPSETTPHESEHEARALYLLESEAFDPDHLRQVGARLRSRTKWFEAEPQELGWATTMIFQRRLARHFGHGRCWLAGDAAHEMGPIGMQSMNLGLSEAEELAGCLADILQQHASLDTLGAYEQTFRNQAAQALHMNGGCDSTRASAWSRQRCHQVTACLPAVGDELAELAGQSGLILPTSPRVLA